MMDRGTGRRRRSLLAMLVVSAGCGTGSAVHAGGSGENALLIVNPSDHQALYLANYYQRARGIPDSNILYMEPDVGSYAEFYDGQLLAFLDTLETRVIDDHIDYVIAVPGARFFLNASGLVTDPCSPIGRFATGSIYTGALIADQIAGGGLAYNLENEYFASSFDAIGFSSNTRWLNGQPSNAGGARSYFIGAMLGYTGARGNTVPQLIEMIDRSVAADGTRPDGTFYYMKTDDPLRSGPREGLFASSIGEIIARGGQAEQIDAVLPIGRHDCLGIMTGWADPDIVNADMTILPGAFADHLTSYAGRFDIGQQTKMSDWITKGASGSVGAVEEPCNWPGKFPRPSMHVFYFQGMSLGEAYFRSAEFFPFQMLLYGDPLARPFAWLPEVDVPDAPAGPVSGTVTLTPVASTQHPSGQIDALDLLVDGILVDTIAPGGAFQLDTTMLDDGWHDLRVLAFDDTAVRSVGRWTGALVTDNFGQSASIGATPTGGNLTTLIEFDLAAAGGSVRELRLLHNDRVLAAIQSGDGQVSVHAQLIGAGRPHVYCEALFDDGSIVRSAPLELDISFAAGSPSGQLPVAFSYTKLAPADRAFVVELPATFDDLPNNVGWTIDTPPAQATIIGITNDGYRILLADPDARGLDTIVFHCNSPAGRSNDAVITLDFGEGLCPDGCEVLPEVFNVGFGRYISGGLAELAESDDAYLRILQMPAPSPLFPLMRLNLQGTAPTDSLSELRFIVEANATALPATVPQRIRLFNWRAGRFDQIDDRLATRFDSVVEVVIDTNASDYVRPDLATIFGDVSWWNPGAVISPNWGANIDQAIWVVTP